MQSSGWHRLAMAINLTDQRDRLHKYVMDDFFWGVRLKNATECSDTV